MNAPMRIATFLIAATIAPCFAQSRPSDTFQTSAGAVRITPIMHAAVLIQAGGKNIYLDPAQG